MPKGEVFKSFEVGYWKLGITQELWDVFSGRITSYKARYVGHHDFLYCRNILFLSLSLSFNITLSKNHNRTSKRDEQANKVTYGGLLAPSNISLIWINLYSFNIKKHSPSLSHHSLSSYLSLYLPIYLSILLSSFLSICLFIYLFILQYWMRKQSLNIYPPLPTQNLFSSQVSLLFSNSNQRGKQQITYNHLKSIIGIAKKKDFFHC